MDPSTGPLAADLCRTIVAMTPFAQVPGRYRFTTEPNLNKVVLEREGAIGDDRIETLLREAIAAVAPTTPVLRIEPHIGIRAGVQRPGPERRHFAVHGLGQLRDLRLAQALDAQRATSPSTRRVDTPRT
jgi:hypothetical protein